MLRTARKRMIPAPWSGDECPSKLWRWKISLGYMYHALYQTLHMDAPACTRYMLQIIIVRKIVCKIVKADVHWLALVSKELPFAMECCHKTTPKIANSKWGLIDDRYPPWGRTYAEYHDYEGSSFSTNLLWLSSWPILTRTLHWSGRSKKVVLVLCNEKATFSRKTVTSSSAKEFLSSQISWIMYQLD